MGLCPPYSSENRKALPSAVLSIEGFSMGAKQRFATMANMALLIGTCFLLLQLSKSG